MDMGINLDNRSSICKSMSIYLFPVITASIFSVALLASTSIAHPVVGNTQLVSNNVPNKLQNQTVRRIETAPRSINDLPRVALTQSTEVTCGQGLTTYAKAETKGYYVNICGDSNGPNRYLGAGKSGQAIVLPLQSYSSGKYTAVSGNVRYTLTSSYLTVTQRGRTILKQQVISWR
jgi:hypothetical protein